MTLEDYDDVVAPAEWNEVSAIQPKIHLLHVLGDRLTGHSASALIEDAKLGYPETSGRSNASAVVHGQAGTFAHS